MLIKLASNLYFNNCKRKCIKSFCNIKFNNFNKASRLMATAVIEEPRMSCENSDNKRKEVEDERYKDENWVKRIKLNPETKAVKLKKYKYILLISFCGKNYYGMQRNPGFTTIESTLISAFTKCGLFTEREAKEPILCSMKSAARTDKGVSAIRQILSVELPIEIEKTPSIHEQINEHLPPEIRIMTVVKVTKKFDAKGQCDSRTYSYLAPTFAFALIKEGDESYRIPSEKLEELREILEKYKGTHNFHNFTAKVKYHEACAQRYIIHINCCDPYVKQGIEWTRINIKGQSFMLHQIRKMVGLVSAVMRGHMDVSVYERVWQRPKIDVPIAPSLGLVLEEPHYDYYNSKYCYTGMPFQKLTWEDQLPAINDFRSRYIDCEVEDTEVQNKAMLEWLKTLFLHDFESTAKEEGAKAAVQEVTSSDAPSGESNKKSADNNDTKSTEICSNVFENSKIEVLKGSMAPLETKDDLVEKKL